MRSKKSNGACPLCGGTLIYDEMYQYAKRYRVLKNGKLSTKCSKHDIGPEEVGVLYCVDCERQFEDYHFNSDGRIEIYFGKELI